MDKFGIFSDISSILASAQITTLRLEALDVVDSALVSFHDHCSVLFTGDDNMISRVMKKLLHAYANVSPTTTKSEWDQILKELQENFEAAKKAREDKLCTQFPGVEAERAYGQRTQLSAEQICGYPMMRVCDCLESQMAPPDSSDLCVFFDNMIWEQGKYVITTPDAPAIPSNHLSGKSKKIALRKYEQATKVYLKRLSEISKQFEGEASSLPASTPMAKDGVRVWGQHMPLMMQKGWLKCKRQEGQQLITYGDSKLGKAVGRVSHVAHLCRVYVLNLVEYAELGDQ